MDMKKLMCPRSIVVIGASDKPGMTGGCTLAAINGTTKDHAYFVNPRRDELHGRKCYHSLSELPEVVDCMVLVTPARTVAGYLEEGGAMGIKAAVVIASGFSEERSEEAHRLAKEVEDVCKKYDIALCGPNCVGILNGLDRVAPGTHGESRLLTEGSTGGMAVVAQSGYLTGGFSVPDDSQLAYVVSAGNCTICSIEDYMYYFAQDDRVSCIAAYAEGVRKPDRLVEALRLAAQKRKPVVVLKAGISEKGSVAAASHTGSLAGDYKTYEAVFKKFGVITTQTAQEFVTTARMFSVLWGNFPKNTGMCGLNFSGGENTQCADNCARCGIELPTFADQTVEALRSVLPSYATPSNPLDATTTLFSENEKVRTLFRAISDDPSIGLIALGNDVGINSEAKDLTCVKLMGEMAAEGTLLPAVVIPTFEKSRHPEIYHQFEQAGIPVLSTGPLAFEAVRHLMDFVSFRCEDHKLELALPADSGQTETVSLSEAQSKAELVPYGVRVPAQALAKSAEDLDRCLAEVPFPVVMKVESPDILHKTDAGAVRLNITTREAALAAFQAILDNCRAYRPDARIDGVMVQEMVPSRVEMILGIKNDRQFGPMLLAGLGGVFVEIFSDAALCPCPLSRPEAEQMLRSLKGFRLLNGYRGSKPCDVDALVDLMVRLAAHHLLRALRAHDRPVQHLYPDLPQYAGHGCLPPLQVAADAAVYSHSHFDHCCPAAVRLTGRPCPLRIQALSTFHDEDRGARLGSNLVHIISDGDVRVAHLGDLGHELSAAQLAELGTVDALLVNVGGYGHHSATPLALRLVESVRPRIVIPMHYRLECWGPESSDTADAFLAQQRVVEYADQNSILVGPDEQRNFEITLPFFVNHFSLFSASLRSCC